MAYAYIAAEDITDSVAKKFVETQDLRVSTWVDRANAEVESLAVSHDVQPADIETDPVHPMVLDFARAVFCEACFLDNLGTNNTEIPDDEKYMRKYQLYKDRIYTLRISITPEMFSLAQASMTGAGMAGGGIMWRG